MGHVGVGLAIFLCLFSLAQGEEREENPFGSPLQCQEPPRWDINGNNPVAGTGKVTLVALLQAS